MKYPLYLIFLFAIASCAKKNDQCNFLDSKTVAPDSEVNAVHAYVSSLGLNALQDPSGFFYKIKAQGTGQEIANLCTNVTVKYKGRLTNGTIFDSTATNNTATFQLGQVIVGWQKGLPLISTGGSITLFVPPSLAYGANQSGPIPPNSILVFDIDLVGVK